MRTPIKMYSAQLPITQGPTPSPTHIHKKDPYRVTCEHLLRFHLMYSAQLPITQGPASSPTHIHKKDSYRVTCEHLLRFLLMPQTSRA